MAHHQIEKLITDLFKSQYPNCKFDFKYYNDIIHFSSTFADKVFVNFTVRKNSISQVKTINRYIPEVKKLFHIHKMKRTDFKIVDDFFTQISSNINFNKVFTIKNTITANEWVSFKKESKFFVIPSEPSTKSRCVFIGKLRNTHYRCSFENNFKMSKDGSIFIVPMIRLFDYQKNSQVFAFNIYNQTIVRVKKEEFFFEDFFENNEIFNSDYHGDVFVDEYIDNILYDVSEDDEIRQELILYPRDKLSAKVDLISMYMI